MIKYVKIKYGEYREMSFIERVLHTCVNDPAGCALFLARIGFIALTATLLIKQLLM